MEQNEFDEIVKELKKKCLIQFKREIIPLPEVRYLIFASNQGRIFYQPKVLFYFNREEICWCLLHEEYHCSTFLGAIPILSESYASKHANETITEFDPKLVPEEVFRSYLINAKKYQSTLPSLNKIQKFYLKFGLLK